MCGAANFIFICGYWYTARWTYISLWWCFRTYGFGMYVCVGNVWRVQCFCHIWHTYFFAALKFHSNRCICTHRHEPIIGQFQHNGRSVKIDRQTPLYLLLWVILNQQAVNTNNDVYDSRRLVISYVYRMFIFDIEIGGIFLLEQGKLLRSLRSRYHIYNRYYNRITKRAIAIKLPLLET